MNKIILILSPTSLHQGITFYDDEHPESSSAVSLFKIKDLEKTVFSIPNIKSVTLIGNENYTKKMEQRLKQYELTSYGKSNIEYKLIERSNID